MKSLLVPHPSPLRLVVCLACASAAASSTFAHASDVASAAISDQVIVPTVTVTGHADGDRYVVKRTTAGSKTDTALIDLPQSITIINEALIKDMAMQSMNDVTRYVPGITMANGEGNRDSPIFRGSSNASGDFYIDGVRDDVEYYRDLYNVEQVEALTGPNAMIFGRGGSGGVINRVIKQANFSTVRALNATFGSYKNRRLTADVGQALNDTVAMRVTALVEDSGGYQRNFSLKRSGVNPTVTVRPSKDTNVVLGYEHFEDERTTDRGVPSLNGIPLDLPVEAFFGDPSAAGRPTRLTSDAVSSIIDHDFGNGVHLSNKTRFTDYDKLYQNYNSGAINAKTSQVPITAYNNHQSRKNLFNQTDMTLKLQVGGITQTILVGIELSEQNTDYLRKTGLFSNNTATINVPVTSPDGPLPVSYVLGGSNSDRDGYSKAKTAGVYVQDQLDFNQQWKLIGGLRYDRFTLDYHNNRASGTRALLPAAADLSSKDNLVSPRLGLIYKPMPFASAYANYSVASFPRGGDQLSSLSVVNQGLKPEKFVNFEIGGKYEITPDLMTTLAIYRLNRNNVAVANPMNGIVDRLVDGQRTSGVEIGINGKLTKAWSVNGGYSHQNATLLATATATALSGSKIGMVPRKTLSLWNRYDFTRALGFGLGLIYRDDMYASTSNAVTLPGYTRIDAAAYYNINANYQVQLNVENLGDRKYYMYANGDNNITPGSPRSVRMTVRANF